MNKHIDTFLTHTWRYDLHDRNNHQRVTQVNEHLRRRGFVTWFDSKRMEGRIDNKLSEQVDSTLCVLVFVTEAYMMKLDSGDQNDNLAFEYESVMRKKKDKVFIVMEKRYENSDTWFGRLKRDFSGNPCMSMADDFNDPYLKQKMDELVDHLRLKSVVPSQIRKICPSCKIYNEDYDPLSLHGEGTYCTICRRSLRVTGMPLYYCDICHGHRHGWYCNTCNQDVLDSSIKIVQNEDQYMRHVELKTRVESKSNPSLAAKCENEIEIIHDELQKLDEKRFHLQRAGVILEMSDRDYTKQRYALKESIARLKQTSSNLSISAQRCCKGKEVDNVKMQRMRDVINELCQQRNEISQWTKYLSTGFNACVETSELINKQMFELLNNAVLIKPETPSNHFHDGLCKCDVCKFGNELNKQIRLDGGKNFLRALITDDKVSEMKMALRLRSEILQLTEGNGFNFLLHVTSQHGSIAMFHTLLDAGVKVDGTNDRKETLLHLVTNTDIAKALCEKHGSTLLKMKSLDGLTPFQKAYKNKNFAVATAIIPFIETPEEELRLYFCRLLEDEGIGYLGKLIHEDNIDIMTIILSTHPHLVHMVDEFKNTPLLLCSKDGSASMLELLLDNGSDVNHRDVDGWTSLHLSLWNDDEGEPIADYLCTKFPYLITSVNKIGWSVFHLAVLNNKVNFARLLIRHSSPPSLLLKRNSWGDSPLEYARKEGKDSMVQIFEDYLKKHGVVRVDASQGFPVYSNVEQDCGARGNFGVRGQ